MFQPVYVALGRFMGRFFEQLTPTTRPMYEYVQRDLAHAILLAPARMIDSAEDMLAKLIRLDADSETTAPHKFPVIILAVSKDYTPTMRDYTRQIADRVEIIMPNDPKERVFGLRTVSADLRCQIAIFAQEPHTAHSIAAQFLLWIDQTENRRFTANYRFAGCDNEFPVQIEDPGAPAMSVQTEAKNAVILALDLTLKVTAPLFDFPKKGEPNDGKGIPGDEHNPAGYPRVIAASMIQDAGDDRGTVEMSDRTVVDEDAQ